MPTRALPLWLFTIALLIGAPIVNIVYWLQVLASGTLPHDGDAVAIPMAGGVILTLMLAPLVLGTAWICLRRYDPGTRLAAWRQDRPVRSLLATLVFGGPALVLAAGAVHDLLTPGPWYEHIPVALSVPCIIWLLAMRAAFVEQRGPAPASRRAWGLSREP